MAEAHTVDVGGRRLKLSNLDKPLYPETGTTKGEVLHHYTTVAPTLLPHLAGRPATFRRYPDGAGTAGFFAKNVPAGTPDWVARVTLPAPGSTKDREMVTYPLLDELPALIWAANLAALELHVPQWQVVGDAPQPADRLVIDLDPGPPATIVECCAVALLVREALAADGLTAYPCTSGSKGMQLYAPIEPTASERVAEYAHQVARVLERAHPRQMLSRMDRAARHGKVFLDWSQNNAAKTTITPYSLRARPAPTIATPLTWDEVAACRDPATMRFLPADVAERLAEHGDLLADLRPDSTATRAPVPAAG